MAERVTTKDLEFLYHAYFLYVAPFALLVYDYILTFPAEVERFWRFGGLSWASFFFYLNRYVVLFGHAPVIVEYFWLTTNPNKKEICHSLQVFHQYFAIIIQLIVGVLLVMRVYALYERNKYVLTYYLILIPAALGIGCYFIFASKNKSPEVVKADVHVPIGCGATLSKDGSIGLAVAWGGNLVFDVSVFGMTLYKALTIPRVSGVNLVSVLMRDGAVYFGVIVLFNIANIITFVIGGPTSRGVLVTFTNCVSSLMVSRLMLNLRHPSLVPRGKWDNDMTHSTQPNLTFIEQPRGQHTEDSDLSWQGPYASVDTGTGHPKFRSRFGHQRRLMYDYLARGPGRPSFGSGAGAYDNNSVELSSSRNWNRA